MLQRHQHELCISWGIMYPKNGKHEWDTMVQITDDIWKILGISSNIGIS